MKLKRFLSGALAAAVALTTMALTPFTTASAADTVTVNTVFDWVYANGMTDLVSLKSGYMDYAISNIVIPDTVEYDGNTFPITRLQCFYDSTTYLDFGADTTTKSITYGRNISNTSSYATTAGYRYELARFQSLEKVTYLYEGTDFVLQSNLAHSNTYDASNLKEIYIYAKGISSIGGANVFRGMSEDLKVYVTSDEIKQQIYDTCKGSAYYPIKEEQIIVFDPDDIIVDNELDYESLDEYISQAEQIDADLYTIGSYSDLIKALSNAKTIREKSDATQDEIDSATAQIVVAIKNLVEKTATGTCGENVTWSLDAETGILTISGTGAMYEGNKNGATSWTYSKYADVIKEVVIEEGVTSVGSCAFGPANYNDSTTAFPNLTKITIPSTIEKIEKGAFEYSNITNLTVPENVTDIGAFAYAGSKIETVTLNEGIGLGGDAFKGCNSLKEVTIPAGITYRRDANWTGDNGVQFPFESCTSLEKVTILGGGTNVQRYEQYENALADGMFEHCKSLKEVIIKCDDLAYVASADSSSEYTSETFETLGTNITYYVYKGSTTEKTLRDAGYLTDDNVVYSLDLTELNANITEAEAIDADNYTAESYAVLTAALETANAVKANTDAVQDDIDSAAAALKAALDALEALDVDGIKASLEELTGNIEKLLTVKDESDYTEESWTALNEALTAAEEALASEEALTYKEYSALYDALSGAYTGLATVSTSDSEYVGTIYGGYEVTYNHETDSYKVVVSDDVDMDKVVGTTYVKVTLTPNTADLQYQLAYGTLNIWNFLDNFQQYKSLNATEDNVFTYNLSIPSADSAFSLTAGTGWTKDTEVFYVKSVDFYNANDELLYTYNVDSIGVGDVRKLTNAVEDAEALDMSKYTEESAAVLAAVIEDAKATLNNPFATKDDYRVRVSELEAAVNALELIEVELADYKAVYEAIASIPNGVTFTEESLAVLNKAVEAVIYDLDISHQAEVDAWAKAIEDAIAGLEVKAEAGTVSGTIYVSDEEAKTEMTVAAVSADGTEVSTTATSMGTYTFDNLTVGDYTLTISGGKYAPRSYEITVEAGDNAQDVKLNPYGDINGDGDITTADVGLANSHAKGVKTLTDYDFACGDVNNDGSISTADVGMINSHAKGVKTLW